VTVRLFALTCGSLTGNLGCLMEGGEGQVELPIPSYLIEHPRGTVLFDTGMHPDCQRDPAQRVGSRIAGLFSFANKGQAAPLSLAERAAKTPETAELGSEKALMRSISSPARPPGFRAPQ
jgi:hypothetical protein